MRAQLDEAIAVLRDWAALAGEDPQLEGLYTATARSIAELEWIRDHHDVDQQQARTAASGEAAHDAAPR